MNEDLLYFTLLYLKYVISFYLSVFGLDVGCFPSTAKAILENRKSVAMSELQTGDKVQTGNSVSMFK